MLEDINTDTDLDTEELELDWTKIGTYVATAVVAVGAWKGFQWMKNRRAAKAVVVEIVPNPETPDTEE